MSESESLLCGMSRLCQSGLRQGVIALDMIEIPYLGNLDKAEIYGVSDLHSEDNLFDEKLWKKFKAKIKSVDYPCLIGIGDWLNYAVSGSKTNPGEQTRTVGQSEEWLIEECKELKPWIMAMADDGNHERRKSKQGDGLSPIAFVCKTLDIPYMENGGILKVTLGKDSHGKRVCYSIYAFHGEGAKTRVANINSVVYADVYLHGHTHFKQAYKENFFMPDLQNGGVREVEQLYVTAAPWLCYGGYAQRKAYRPAARGAYPIILNGRYKCAEVLL